MWWMVADAMTGAMNLCRGALLSHAHCLAASILVRKQDHQGSFIELPSV